jgi:two-component system, OmpR family, phosphate regulon sensor histidine kinase PhoR
MTSSRILRWILPAIVAALFGLGALQVVLLRESDARNREAFRQNASGAVQQAARSMEFREAQRKVSRLMTTVATGSSGIYKSVRIDTMHYGTSDSVRMNFSFSSAEPVDDSVVYSGGFLRFVRTSPPAEIPPPGGGKVVVRKIFNHGVQPEGMQDSMVVVVADAADDRTPSGQADSVRSARRTELVASMLQVFDLPDSGENSYEVRPEIMDSLLKFSMSQRDITIPFVFGLAAGKNNSLLYASDSGYAGELRQSDIAAGLFPARILPTSGRLVVFFPGRELFLFRKLLPSLLSMLAFMAVILGAFIVTLRTLRRQKETAARLADFVNNVTHEFKTPITTIAVATDTLANPATASQPAKVEQYNSIIRDEIGRLKTHVDRILQLAVLEEGDFEYRFTPIDANGVVREAVERLELRVGQRGGAITTSIEADRPMVNADPYHLLNIVMNILDNAEKYSPERPVIAVRTWNIDGNFCCEVNDHGIGIATADQEHLFEKYFRVTEGNRHDVKGFGIGLAYVRTALEAHNGTVNITSAPGKGTTVRFTLPLTDQ